MATFKNFTDIDAWQRARALTNAIYVSLKKWVVFEIFWLTRSNAPSECFNNGKYR